MIKTYINYPNPHVTVHNDPNCKSIQSHDKLDQRYRYINWETIAMELENFRNNEYRFTASSESNDMWLEIDFQDQIYESDVLEFICRLLGEHHSPFKDLKPKIHC